MVNIKLSRANSNNPRRQSPTGYDISTIETKLLKSGSSEFFSTGVYFYLPVNTIACTNNITPTSNQNFTQSADGCATP